MNLYVGTSGYSYPAWKGPFYPAKLPDRQMLRFYGEQFRTVEINYTFRRMPTVELLEKWADSVPADFRFVLKVPEAITHHQRLQDVGELLSKFLAVAAALRDRLGAVLFQLPPDFRKDAVRLRDVLALLPSSGRAAFEFRHPSWFDDEVFGLLHDSRAALCLAEAEGGLDVPVVATAAWGYVRLRRPHYDRRALSAWLRCLRGQGWREAFVFFEHEDLGHGPRLAKELLELAALPDRV
jgi:uncharacterized protein YecE (DUF72 family)